MDSVLIRKTAIRVCAAAAILFGSSASHAQVPPSYATLTAPRLGRFFVIDGEYLFTARLRDDDKFDVLRIPLDAPVIPSSGATTDLSVLTSIGVIDLDGPLVLATGGDGGIGQTNAYRWLDDGSAEMECSSTAGEIGIGYVRNVGLASNAGFAAIDSGNAVWFITPIGGESSTTITGNPTVGVASVFDYAVVANGEALHLVSETGVQNFVSFMRPIEGIAATNSAILVAHPAPMSVSGDYEIWRVTPDERGGLETGMNPVAMSGRVGSSQLAVADFGGSTWFAWLNSDQVSIRPADGGMSEAEISAEEARKIALGEGRLVVGTFGSDDDGDTLDFFDLRCLTGTCEGTCSTEGVCGDPEPTDDAGPGPGDAGTNDAGTDDGGPGTAPKEELSCTCRAAGAPTRTPWTLLALGAAFWWRRRR